MRSAWDELIPLVPTRWQRFKGWWSPARLIGAGLLLLGAFGAAQDTMTYLPAALAVFFQNISAELFGIGFTILVIDWANERRATRERQSELMLQMSSPENAFAIEAVRILRKEGWLWDGTLRGANLSGAHLAKAFLKDANLEQVNLADVNLREANLINARLNKTFFFRTDLQDAKLAGAQLQWASLSGVNLSGAWLENAQLQGANLQDADLRGVNCTGAQMDAYTTLPDGTHWTPERDMRQFTHPDA